MRKAIVALLAAGLSAHSAAAVEPVIAAGETLEAQAESDFDGDGAGDLAYIVAGNGWRELRVALSSSGRGRSAEALDLGVTRHGPGKLSIAGDALQLEDVTGGSTAIASTRRFRYDGSRKRMRLIALEARLYSPTFAHDGFEASWNLLNGDTMSRELLLDESGGQPAYKPVREVRATRRSRPVWLADSPDPETLIEEMREG